MGQPLFDKMLGRELLAHAVQDRGGPFSGIAEPAKAFIGVYAPWSAVAVVGFWRIIRSPSHDPVERRVERFLLCWFLCGLILFSIAAHQRGRLIYPLIPAAAMVAGVQLSRWMVAVRTKPLLAAASAVAAGFLAGSFYYTHLLVAPNRRIQETLAMQALAERLKTVRRGEFPLLHVRGPLSLQVWLNTRRAELSPQAAAALLAEGPPVFVVTKDSASIRAAAPTNAVIHALYGWTDGRSTVEILSNRRQIQ